MSKPHNIFISWSGDRSRAVAEALKDWLPRVVQSARPWLSTRDIEKGTRSLSEMTKALSGMGFGITCLTPENLDAPWILYEAGALSKTFDDDRSRLWTYLLGDLDHKDVEPPLSQFQHTKAEKEDTFKLIQSINTAINDVEDRLSDEVLRDSYGRFWKDLEDKLRTMPPPEKPAKAKRTPDQMTTEILELCRQYLPKIDTLENPLGQTVPLSSLTGLPGSTFDKLKAIAQFNPALYNTGIVEPILPAKHVPGAMEPTPRHVYYVKIKNDPEVKRLIGTAHSTDHGGLMIFDSADMVANFTDNVEQWWVEP